MASPAHSQELARRFMPVYRFHAKERYFPCSVEDYLSKCELWYGDTRVLNRGQVTEKTLATTTLDIERDGKTVTVCSCDPPPPPGSKEPFWRLRLLGDDQEYDTAQFQDTPARLHTAKVYARVRRVAPNGKSKWNSSPNGQAAFEINYWSIYYWNGSYTICGCGLDNPFWSCQTGGHEADLEHVTVRTNAKGNKLVSMHYAAHRRRDGTWLMGDKVEMYQPAPDNKSDAQDLVRPMVYVAHNGHGSYPYAGCYPRLCCLANDWTGDDGVEWAPNHAQLDVLEPDEKDDLLFNPAALWRVKSGQDIGQIHHSTSSSLDQHLKAQPPKQTMEDQPAVDEELSDINRKQPAPEDTFVDVKAEARRRAESRVDKRWSIYFGSMGKDGVGNAPSSEWWVRETEDSRGWWKRLCCLDYW